MTVINNPTINLWMRELWAWADKFEIPEEDLPRNQDDLLAITDLDIRSNQLFMLPNSISQLKNLKKLNISSCHLEKIPQTIGDLKNLTHLKINCEALESLPQSLGQLSQLEGLIVISNKIKRLPDSLANLIHLCVLDIPTQLIEQLPMSIIERYRDKKLVIRNVPFTTLYTPSTDEYSLSEFGFFIIEDGWNKESLTDLKYKTGADFLFGLQTTEKTLEELDLIDGVIFCQPDEVQQVMSIYEFIILSSRTTIGLDLNDLKIPFWYTKPAKFIQTNAIGSSESERLKRGLNHIISQIPKSLSIDYIIISFESDRNLSLDEFSDFSTAVENRIMDNSWVFYDVRYVDNTECRWIGVIYVTS